MADKETVYHRKVKQQECGYAEYNDWDIYACEIHNDINPEISEGNLFENKEEMVASIYGLKETIYINK